MHEPVPIPPRLPAPPRDPLEDVVVDGRLAGRTMQQLADDHGLTVTRVRELLALNGLTTAQLKDRRVRERLARHRALARRITTQLERRGPMTASGLARQLGTTPAQVERAIRPQDRERLLPAPAHRWSDDDLAWWLAVYLQRFRSGRVRGGETRGAYDVWARHDPRVPPGEVLLARFGSWRKAKAAAEEQEL